MSRDELRRRVKDIVTTGCNNNQYMRIFRAPDLEDRMNVAAEMGVLDVSYYKRLVNKLNDPRIRVKVLVILVLGGMCANSAALANLFNAVLL